MVFNIQVLRALAAVLVVHGHAAGGAGLGLHWVGGANGVDLFFVISGFIIAYVSNIDAHQFMTRRLIRIVPIYWASTTVIFVLALTIPTVFHNVPSDPGLFIRSLLFIPDAHSGHQDGVLHPTLSGGWTLNYEMYFYVVFWIALAVSRARAHVIAAAIMAAVVVVVQLTSLSDSSIAKFYGSPIVFEFVYGLIAFNLTEWIARSARIANPSRWVDLALCTIAGAGIVVLAFNAEIFPSGPRWLISGIPAFFVVVAAVLMERVRNLKVTMAALVAIGDASYVLYLIHAYVVFGVIRMILRKQGFGEVSGQFTVLGLVAISIVFAVLIYQYFERPILRRLKRAFIKPAHDPVPASATSSG